MMNAEEDIGDLSEEIVAMNLTSEFTTTNAAATDLIIDGKLSSASLSPLPSQFSSKSSSLSYDLKAENSVSGPNSIGGGNDTHTPVKLEAHSQNASALFGNQNHNPFPDLSNKSIASSSSLFSAASGHDDFLKVDSATSLNNSYDFVNNDNYAQTSRLPISNQEQPQPSNINIPAESIGFTEQFSKNYHTQQTHSSDSFIMSTSLNNTTPSEKLTQTSVIQNQASYYTNNARANVQDTYQTSTLMTSPTVYQPSPSNPTFPITSNVNSNPPTHLYSNQSYPTPIKSEDTSGSSGLFIPSMYDNQSNNSQQTNFFVPAQPEETPHQQNTFTNQLNNQNFQQQFQPQNFYSSQSHMGGQQLSSASYYGQPFEVSHEGSTYQIQTGVDEQGKGIWEWIKKTVHKDWSEGAQNIKKQIKSATDSVLTTLDPGMKTYLNAVTNIGVGSQNTSIVLGIEQGFTQGQSVAVIKSQDVYNSAYPVLPIGFDTAIKSTNEMLETLSTIQFGFTSDYIVVTAQIFLTELIPTQWSAMICVCLKDPARNILLHSFSQAISLPTECVTIAYNRTTREQKEGCYGYDISIDEAVRLYIPYNSSEEDWCSVLTGIPLQKILAITSQCLAQDYKRQTLNMTSQYLPYQQLYNNSTASHQQNYYLPQGETSAHQSAVAFDGF